MSDPKDSLAALLDSIFEDGIVEVQEREALARLASTLDKSTVAETFRAFLSRKWGEVMADDVLTGQERLLLGRIVSELDLGAEDIPVQARMALRDV